MQRFKILIKRDEFEQKPVSSDLKFIGNYYVYSDSIGGDIVNEYNVKEFLDNPDNEIVARNFIEYVKANLSTEEFREAFFDSKKLSNLFNAFYNSIRLEESPKKPNIEPITENTILSSVTISNNTFIDERQRSYDLNTFIYDINQDENFYLPIKINKNTSNVPQINFSTYFSDKYGNSIVKKETIRFRGWRVNPNNNNRSIRETYTIKTNISTQKIKYLNGFVQENFNDNESEFWRDSNIAPKSYTISPKKVFFNMSDTVELSNPIDNNKSLVKIILRSDVFREGTVTTNTNLSTELISSEPEVANPNVNINENPQAINNINREEDLEYSVIKDDMPDDNDVYVVYLKISLLEPSVIGYESASVIIQPGRNTSVSDYIILGESNLKWSAGERDKQIRIGLRGSFFPKINQENKPTNDSQKLLAEKNPDGVIKSLNINLGNLKNLALAGINSNVFIGSAYPLIRRTEV
jgi:hypothetical protein